MKRSLTALLAFVMALCASFALCVPAWADDSNLHGALLNASAISSVVKSSGTSRDGFTADVTVVELNDSTEEGADCNFSFDFSISGGGIGNTLQPGDQFKVDGNISELFDADWNSLPRLTLLDKNSGEPLLYAQIQSDGILFTVAKGASGSMSISGTLTSSGLKAKDLGLEPGESKNMTLTVGRGSDSITFTKPSDEPEEPSGQNPGTVDLDTFWKNAGSTDDERGAWVTMEVNPFGSMDLYGSTTYPAWKGKRVPKSYKNLYVEDEIPEHGFIDVQSLQIHASVPAIKKSEYDFDDKWHGYDVPKGTYFAQRVGTQWYGIRDTKMTRLEQNSDENETIDAFRARVRSTSLSWGIYYDADADTETFMCNFGNVNVEGNDNGLYYEDFQPSYVEEYPEIFGKNGASHGNIVSYHIQFTTYYPSIIGEKSDIKNTATLYCDNGRVGGNTSGPYTINNRNGVGVVRANELAFRLVDEDDPTIAIAGAKFRIEQWDDATQKWEDTGVVCTTDEDGCISIRSFSAARYRLVQISWTDDYVPDYTTYADDGNALNGDIEQDGQFVIADTDRFGCSGLAKNRKVSEITLSPVSVTAYTGGDSQNGTSFPAIRYSISGIDNDSIADLTFEFASDDPNGANSEFKAQKVGDNLWILPRLKNTFTLAGTDEKAAEDDAAPGIYEIGIEPGKLTATLTTEGEDGTAKTTTYDVVLASGHSATVTVRNVSDPDGVLDNEVDIAQPVVSSAEDVDTSDGIGMAVIPEGATYHTNGSDSGLGLLGDTEDGTPEISLLFDDLIPGDEGEDTVQLLIDRANNEESVALSRETSQFKYLDLINENDGNAWVSSDKDVTVYWPIPDNAPKGADANFKVYHFEGLHREYRDNLSEQVEACGVTPIECEVVDGNVVFTLDADAAHGCFSPFALAWDPSYTVEFYYEKEGEYPATADGSATRYAASGTEVNATEADMTPDPDEGSYVLDKEASTLQGTVAADGSLTLKVYFKQQFTVTYTDGVEGEEVFADQVTSGIGYGDQTPAFEGGTPSRAGYTFAGWAPEVADTVTADATYVAQWAPIWNPGPGPDDPDPDTPEPDDPEPDNPEPEDPDTPDNPDPDDPDNPDTPDDPDDPDQPDPDQPGDPEDPGEPSDPDQPTGDTPDPDTPASTPDDTPGDSDLPQTGDASLLIAGAAASASVTAFAAAAVVRKRK